MHITLELEHLGNITWEVPQELLDKIPQEHKEIVQLALENTFRSLISGFMSVYIGILMSGRDAGEDFSRLQQVIAAFANQMLTEMLLDDDQSLSSMANLDKVFPNSNS